MYRLIAVISITLVFARFAFADTYEESLNLARNVKNHYQTNLNPNPQDYINNYTGDSIRSKHFNDKNDSTKDGLNDTVKASSEYMLFDEIHNALKAKGQNEEAEIEDLKSSALHVIKRSNSESLERLDKTTCINGSCQEAEAASSQKDFGESIAKLKSVVDSSSGMNQKELTIFEGKALTCHKIDSMNINCCKMDSGVDSCSNEERELHQTIVNKVVTLVNKRHDKSNGYIKYYDYCVFPSKIARITQEQGRLGQLGIKLSKQVCDKWSKHKGHCKRYVTQPNCRGITPDEMTKIDLDRIDYTESYDDISNDYQSPDQDSIYEKARRRAEENT